MTYKGDSKSVITQEKYTAIQYKMLNVPSCIEHLIVMLYILCDFSDIFGAWKQTIKENLSIKYASKYKQMWKNFLLKTSDRQCHLSVP